MEDFQIIFNYVDATKTEELHDYITTALKKLKSKYDFIQRADIFLRMDNRSEGQNATIEIRLSAPGPRLYAESNEKNFRAATKETIRDLFDQLQKRKRDFTSGISS